VASSGSVDPPSTGKTGVPANSDHAFDRLGIDGLVGDFGEGFRGAGKLGEVETEADKLFSSGGFQALNTFLQSKVAELAAAGAPCGDAETMAMNEKEGLFKSASDTASFDMRSTVGQWWSREVKSDKRMAAEYKQLGRNYEAQREFRRVWAANKFELLRTERTRVESLQSSTKMQGTYVPVKIIFDKEGGDCAAAVATANYVMTAITKFNKGEKLDGQEYLRFNSWTRRYDFMHIVLSYQQTHATTWNVTQHERPTIYDDEAGDGPAGSGAPPPKRVRVEPSGSRGLDAEPSGALPAPARPVPKTKAKAKAATPKVTDEEKLAEAERKKILEAKLKKAVNLKVRCDGAQSPYSDVVMAAESLPEWKKWCDKTQLVDVETARSNLDLFKKSSAFWSSWAIQQGFVAFAKKQFSADELEAQLYKFPDAELLVTKLETEIRTLQRMHTARMSK
jgi:hypothetical protein